MPLYEYRCSKCGRTFEKIQKFSDKPGAKCPECGGKSKRLLSAPAIHFKGTGWYVTDYGKGKSEERESDQRKSEERKSDQRKSDEGKSEKPPSKSAAKDSSSKSDSAKTGPKKKKNKKN